MPDYLYLRSEFQILKKIKAFFISICSLLQSLTYLFKITSKQFSKWLDCLSRFNLKAVSESDFFSGQKKSVNRAESIFGLFRYTQCVAKVYCARGVSFVTLSVVSQSCYVDWIVVVAVADVVVGGYLRPTNRESYIKTPKKQEGVWGRPRQKTLLIMTLKKEHARYCATAQSKKEKGGGGRWRTIMKSDIKTKWKSFSFLRQISCIEQSSLRRKWMDLKFR